MFIRSFKDLRVWNNAVDLAMEVYWRSKVFPTEERYNLTTQIRRASRSISGNIAEGWRKRRYPASFVSKLTDAEGETAEVQTWVELARRCKYWDDRVAAELDQRCDLIIGQLSHMANHPQQWCTPPANGVVKPVRPAAESRARRPA